MSTEDICRNDWKYVAYIAVLISVLFMIGRSFAAQY